MGDSSVAWICADRSDDEDIVYADSRVHNGLDAFPARDAAVPPGCHHPKL